MTGFQVKTNKREQMVDITNDARKVVEKSGIKNVYVHFFTDGRDSYPKSALEHLAQWQKTFKKIGVGQVASLVGRFYAMDRAKNWDRLIVAYNLLVKGKGKRFSSRIPTIRAGL